MLLGGSAATGLPDRLTGTALAASPPWQRLDGERVMRRTVVPVAVAREVLLRRGRRWHDVSKRRREPPGHRAHRICWAAAISALGLREDDRAAAGVCAAGGSDADVYVDSAAVADQPSARARQACADPRA